MSNEAWAALASGDTGKAKRLFQMIADEDFATGLLGLARVALAEEREDTALSLAEQLIEHSQTARALALYGECVGRLGRRKEAEDWLLMAIDQDPNDGHAHTLLGEQRIRRGRWDQGANDIIKGLSLGNKMHAFHHVRHVLADLVDAVIANKVKADAAIKFVNKIDYNVAGKTEQMGFFFALVRRSISAREPIQRSVQTRATSERAQSQPARPTEPQRRQQPPQQHRPQAMERTSPAMERTSPAMERTSQPITMRQDAMAPRTNRRPQRGNDSALSQMMQRDRALNEQLQDSIEPIGLPVWPSNHTPLDMMPVLSPEASLGVSAEMLGRTNMRLTTGSVDAEIAVGRANEAIHVASSLGSCAPPDFDPAGLNQLEVQCWDGLLSKMKPIPAVYTGSAGVSAQELALGAFVGACVLRAADATWTFREPANGSEIRVGDQVINPFEVARKWLQVEDKDDVFLDEPIKMAAAASDAEFVSARVFADPTHDLTDQALKLKLAELWMAFRSHPPTDTRVDVAEKIRPIENATDYVIFGLDYHLAPPIARGPQNSAMISNHEIAIAYLRREGTFLILASRKHFARFVAEIAPELTRETANHILKYAAQYHRPHWKVGSGGETPAFSSLPGEGATLTFDFHAPAGPLRFVLSHEPSAVNPWMLRG